MKNKTLLGFHLGHNMARMDSYGFLTPLSHDEAFERLDGHIQQNMKFRGRRDCCYVCGNYVQFLITLDSRIDMESFEDENIFIHIYSPHWNPTENFSPIKMQEFNNMFGTKKNLPPGKISFFFSYPQF